MQEHRSSARPHTFRARGRNCKVITTCFIAREVVEENEIAGDPPGLFIHAQNFTSPEKVLDLVSLICELEREVDPGVETDTILVNNDVGWEPGNRFLASIDGTETFSGKFRVVTRPNYGRSFGGNNRAFELFREEYDFWTFTEDDILVNGDQYYARCIDTFESTAKAGFVAIQGLSKIIRLHAHGGVGTTHTSVLERVYRKYGKLPHCEQHQSQAHYDIVVHGEVAFTSVIKKLGYKLVNVRSDYPLYTFAHDHMKRAGYPAAT